MKRSTVTLLHVLLVLTLIVWEKLGLRTHVGAISGTVPANDAELILGIAYAGAYFITVVWVPIWLLAVAFDALYGRLGSWISPAR